MTSLNRETYLIKYHKESIDSEEEIDYNVRVLIIVQQMKTSDKEFLIAEFKRMLNLQYCEVTIENEG